MQDPDAATVLDGHNPGGVADGASWQLHLQGLQQRVPPDAADLIGS